MLPLTTYTKPGEKFPPECMRAYDNAAELVNEIIEERRAKPGPDVISALIQARDEGDKLTERELFDQVFTLCGAALSATSRAAGGALLMLYTHPQQLAELIRQPNLIPDAVEECLRTPAMAISPFPRAALRYKPGGTKIQGHGGAASPQAANYDPNVLPTRFKTYRHPSGPPRSAQAPSLHRHILAHRHPLRSAPFARFPMRS